MTTPTPDCHGVLSDFELHLADQFRYRHDARLQLGIHAAVRCMSGDKAHGVWGDKFRQILSLILLSVLHSAFIFHNPYISNLI